MIMTSLERRLWPDSCGFFLDGNLITEVVGGSLAHESGLSVGDEIISIGKENLPKFATENLINRRAAKLSIINVAWSYRMSHKTTYCSLQSIDNV